MAVPMPIQSPVLLMLSGFYSDQLINFLGPKITDSLEANNQSSLNFFREFPFLRASFLVFAFGQTPQCQKQSLTRQICMPLLKFHSQSCPHRVTECLKIYCLRSFFFAHLTITSQAQAVTAIVKNSQIKKFSSILTSY